MMRMHANVADTPPMPQMPAKPDSDAALVARLRRGDQTAFEDIVRAYGDAFEPIVTIVVVGTIASSVIAAVVPGDADA